MNKTLCFFRCNLCVFKSFDSFEVVPGVLSIVGTHLFSTLFLIQKVQILKTNKLGFYQLN